MNGSVGRLLVAGLILASCASVGEVIPPASTGETSATLAPTTSITASTSTSSVPEATDTGEVVLVANDQGAFQLGNAEPALLVDGPVLVVSSDHQGGILFQRDQSPGEIYWIPTGEAEPQTLVTPENDHTIVLQDVVIGEEGATLWYTRSRGSTIEDAIDVLYTMTVADGEEVELGVVGGWEAGSRFSVSPDLVVGEWWVEAGHGFSTYDGSYEPVETNWNPYGADGAIDCGPCAKSVDVAKDGSRVAWIEGRESGGFFVETLVVFDTATGEPVAEVSLPDGRVGAIFSLDLGLDSVIISHTGRTNSPWLPVVKVDLTDGSITELNIAGNARFGES